jgi:DeoR/GlpR family transcriptional regulator of sugar metabolism
MTERQTKILEIVSQQRRVTVNELSASLEVSQVTIRKELDFLEKRGLLRREHGFAVVTPANQEDHCMTLNFDAKLKIAKAATELVEDGETIMVESGACCALFAEELANSRKNVTVITNSVYVAHHVRHCEYLKVILLGGEYQPDSEVLVGALTQRNAEVFFADKFFIGAGGFNEKFGFTGDDHDRAQTARDMAAQARSVIVLADSDVFNNSGVQGIVKLEQVSQIITDDKLPPNMELLLVNKNVQVRKVPLINA